MRSVFFILLLAIVGCTPMQQWAMKDPVSGKYDRFRDFTRYTTKGMYGYMDQQNGCIVVFAYVCPGRGDCSPDSVALAVIDLGTRGLATAHTLYMLVDGERHSIPLESVWPYSIWRDPYVYGYVSRGLANKIAAAKMFEGQLNGYEWKMWSGDLSPLRELLSPKTFDLK